MILRIWRGPSELKTGKHSSFQEGLERDPGTYRPVSLISVPDKNKEKIMLGLLKNT